MLHRGVGTAIAEVDVEEATEFEDADVKAERPVDEEPNAEVMRLPLCVVLPD